VVDNDEISTRIIRYLTAEKGGRVTFMPLNQIRASRVTYPTGPDVVPLLKKLKYDTRFGPAFAQVSTVHFVDHEWIIGFVPSLFPLFSSSSFGCGTYISAISQEISDLRDIASVVERFAGLWRDCNMSGS